MSQGLAQYESTVAGFGNAVDSIRSFTSTYDTDFFRNWTEKHNLQMEKLKSASDVSGGIGGAYIAGKMGYAAYQKRKLAQKKKPQDDENEDETPDNQGDENGNENQDAGAAEEEDEEVTGFGDDADAAAEQGVSTDVDGVLENIPSTTSRFGFNLDRDAPEQPEPPPDEAPPVEEAPEIPSAAEAPAADMSAGVEAGTFESGVGGTVTAAPVTTTAAEGGADAASAAAAAGGEEATAGILGAVAGASEVIPFIGIFASIGIGLYELFHHPHKAPSAPPVSTASSKGEMVLPSFDSVTDTPASSSAF